MNDPFDSTENQRVFKVGDLVWFMDVENPLCAAVYQVLWVSEEVWQPVTLKCVMQSRSRLGELSKHLGMIFKDEDPRWLDHMPMLVLHERISWGEEFVGTL